MNAGAGSHLTRNKTIECEASFASVDSYGSVACIQYSQDMGLVQPPSALAYQLAQQQSKWKLTKEGQRPPLLLCGKSNLSEHQETK